MDFTQITRNLEEVLTEEELRQALHSGKQLKHYIGLEISGKVHVGTGLVVMGKVKDLVDAGITPTIFLADWHTWINDKLDGRLETIQRVARGYFTEALKASFRCVGGDPEKLTFVLGSDLYRSEPDYWAMVVRIADQVTLNRAVRSITIMGRKESEDVSLAKLFYPAMQAADIFVLGAHIAHAGMDQRKIHVIARSAAEKLGLKKPIAVHHHLLLSLVKPPVWPIPDGDRRELWEAMKMSKSKPQSAVFIHDRPEEIREKIQKAFCPPGEIVYNPILDWVKHALFLGGAGDFRIPRSPQNGGDMTVDSEELPELYNEGVIHPEDLKNAVGDRLIAMLEPARDHFASGAPKEMLEELEKMLRS